MWQGVTGELSEFCRVQAASDLSCELTVTTLRAFTNVAIEHLMPVRPTEAPLCEPTTSCT